MSARGLLFTLSALVLAVAAGLWFSLRDDAAGRPEPQLGSAREGQDEPERVAVAQTPGGNAAPPALLELQRDAAPASAGVELIDGLLDEDRHLEKSLSRSPAQAHGRVVDADGKPIKAARVLASLAGAHAGASLDAPANLGRVREEPCDEDGRFRLSNLDAGLLRIAVRADGWAPLDLSAQPLPPGESLDLGDLRIERGVRLAGRVLDARLQPVGDAQIFSMSAPLFGPVHRLGPMAASPLGVSDIAGHFELACVAPGAWTLLVFHPEYPQALFSGECSAPDLRRDDLELVLQEAAQINGEIAEYDARATPDLEVIALPIEGMALFEDSRPAGATMEWLGGVRRAKIDELGRFSLRGLGLGMTLGLRVQPKMAPNAVSSLERDDPWGPWVQARAGDVDVRLSYLAGSGLDFQVFAHGSGAPIERMRLELGGVNPSEPRDEKGGLRTHFPQGRVLLTDLRAIASAIEPQSTRDFEASLRIEAPGFDVLSMSPLRMSSGRMLQLGSIVLNPLPVLEVRVVEAQTQDPIAGARVELNAIVPDPRQRTSSSSTTSSDGFARLTVLPKAPANLLVSGAGWESRELPLPPEARPGAPAFVVELNRGAQLSVAVTDYSGSSAPGSVVRLSMGDTPMMLGYVNSQIADSRGIVRFSDVPRGVFKLSAQRIDGIGNTASGALGGSLLTVVVEGGESLELSIQVATLADLTGDLWLGRDPLCGATISIEAGRRGFEDLGSSMDKFSSAPQVRSDERGGFGPIALGAGEYSLLIEHEALGLCTRRVIRMEQRATNVILDLDDTAITGLVTDSSGKPVAGASVRLYSERRNWREELQPRLGDFLMPVADPRVPVSETSTESDGNYRLRAVPPSTSLQMVFALGERAVARARINVAEGRTLEGVNARLPDAGSLRIVLSAPQPPPGQHHGVRIVGLEQPPGLGVEARSFDEQGQALFDGLPPGAWLVMVFALDDSDMILDQRQAQRVQVKAGVETEFSVGW